MDRRSWLWKKKSSSDKSPGGETESSGSMSSHSERYSDDQAAKEFESELKKSQSESEVEAVVVIEEQLSEPKIVRDDNILG